MVGGGGVSPPNVGVESAFAFAVQPRLNYCCRAWIATNFKVLCLTMTLLVHAGLSEPGGGPPPSDFDRSVNPISTGGQNMPPDFQTFLRP